jgi:putative PIG3 family NAD(P)H quinone oxidoreductase
MKYIAITQPGGPEVLQLQERSAPECSDGEILIRVSAAGVNRPDVIQRLGLYPPPPGASDIPGLEVAGTVEALGPGVSRWQIGDQVCALTNGGGYAELVNVPASQCLPIPANLSMVDAACLPETFFTVWTNVIDRGRLQQGDALLIHGGSSGIGVAAIQLAKAMGATVYVTAGSAEKCAACVGLGATLAVNYREQDFVEQVLNETDGRGVDVVLDMVGGDYIAGNLKVAAPEGRIVNIAFQKGSDVQVNLMPIMLKRLTLTGSTLRPQSTEAKGTIAAALEDRVWPLIAAGEIRPVLHSEFSFAEAAAAHHMMEAGQHIGKIILNLEA